MGLIGQAVFVGLQKLSSGLYWLLARIAQGLEWVGKQFGIAEIGAAKFFDRFPPACRSRRTRAGRSSG